MKNLHILIVSALLTLTGCAIQTKVDPNSSFYSIPVGSTLHLNKTVVIPANLGRVYFQSGKTVIGEKNINIYHPHCSLTINSLQNHPQTIKPAAFEIYKIIDDKEYAQQLTYFASTRLLANDDGPTIMGLTSFYYLRSTEEPNVRTLECLQWNDPYQNKYLSINQIKQALGDYFRLELNN